MLTKQNFNGKAIEIVKAVSGGALVIAFMIVAALLMAQTSTTVPNYAMVYVDTQSRHYFAPDCVFSNTNLDLVTVEQARLLEFTPDPTCRDQGYFVQDGRSVLGSYLESWGILPKTKLRWNKDGSWRW